MGDELRSPRMEMNIDDAEEPVKLIEEKLTLLSNYCKSELERLRDMLSDKSLKKQIEKYASKELEEITEQIDAAAGVTVKKVEEHVTELQMFFDELKQKLLAALTVKSNANTKDIALIKDSLGQLKLQLQKVREDSEKKLRTQIEQMGKRVGAKGSKESIDQAKKDVKRAEQEVEKLKGKLGTLGNGVMDVRESIPGVDVMKNLQRKVGAANRELGQVESMMETKATAKSLEEVKQVYASQAEWKKLTSTLGRMDNDLDNVYALYAQMKAEGGRTPAIKAVENLFFRKIQEMQDEVQRVKGDVAKEATSMAMKESRREFVTQSEFKQTKTDHEKKFDAMRAEIERLKQIVDKKNGNALESAMTTIKRLSHELERLKQDINRVRGSVEKAKADCGSKAVEDELRQRLQALAAEMLNVKNDADVKSTKKSLEQLNKSVGQLGKDVETLRASIGKVNRKVDRVQKGSVNTGSLMTSLDGFRDMLKGIEADITSIKDVVTKKSDKQSVQTVKKELAPKKEADRIGQELKKLKSEVSGIGSSVSTVKKSSVKGEVDHGAEESFVKRIMELSQQIEDLRVTLEGKCSATELDAKATKDEIVSVTKAISRLKNSISEMTKAVESIRLDAIAKDTEIRKEIVEVADTKTSELKEDIDRVKQQVETKGSKEELAQIQDKLSQMEAELQKLNTETPKQTKPSAPTMPKDVKSKTDKVQTELTKFYTNSDAKSLEDRIKALEDSPPQVSERSITLDEQPQPDSRLKQLVDNLTEEINQMKTDLANAAHDTSTEPAEQDSDLADAIQAAQARLDKLQTDIANLRAALTGSPDAPPADDTEKQKLREELEELKKRFDKIPQDEEIITHSRLSGIMCPIVIIIFLLLLAITVVSNLHQPNRTEFTRIKNSISHMKTLISGVNERIARAAVLAMKK